MSSLLTAYFIVYNPYWSTIVVTPDLTVTYFDAFSYIT